MQLEQMTTIIGRIMFFLRQSKSGLITIGPIESYSCAARLALSAVQRGWRYQLCSEVGVISCAARLALSAVQRGWRYQLCSEVGVISCAARLALSPALQ